MIARLSLILLMSAGLAAATAARAETVDGDEIVIIDRDTIALPCDPTKAACRGCAEKVRLVGIDAPEVGLHARCPAEFVAGLDAKAALAGVIRGSMIEVTRTGVDRYRRTLARLEVDGRSVDATMIAAGHALPWSPGRESWTARCRHWCPGAARCEE